MHDKTHMHRFYTYAANAVLPSKGLAHCCALLPLRPGYTSVRIRSRTMRQSTKSTVVKMGAYGR